MSDTSHQVRAENTARKYPSALSNERYSSGLAVRPEVLPWASPLPQTDRCWGPEPPPAHSASGGLGLWCTGKYGAVPLFPSTFLCFFSSASAGVFLLHDQRSPHLSSGAPLFVSSPFPPQPCLFGMACKHTSHLPSP